MSEQKTMMKQTLDERFAKLRTAVSASDFESVVADLNREISAAEARKGNLAGELEAAVMGNGDPTKINRSLVSVEDELRTLRAALAVAITGRDDALAVEGARSTEALAQEAKEIGTRLKDAYQREHDALTAALAANADIDREEIALLAANASLEARGEMPRRVSVETLRAGIERAQPNPNLKRKHCREFDRALADLDRGYALRREKSQRSLATPGTRSNPPPVSYGGGSTNPILTRPKVGDDPLAAWRNRGAA